jgi:hypothetical protein
MKPKPEAAYSQLLQETRNPQKLLHLLILVRLLALERSVEVYAQTNELVLWVEEAASKCSDQKSVPQFPRHLFNYSFANDFCIGVPPWKTLGTEVVMKGSASSPQRPLFFPDPPSSE